MEPLLSILRKTEAFFTTKGLESPRLTAELVFAHVLGLKRLELYLQFERPLPPDVLDKARPLVARLALGEPLQYVFGKTRFCDLEILCDKRALIPRPETEELVELLVARFKDSPPADILDLGTGTGAIALALAKAFPQARVLAADRSQEALALAKENAAKNALADRIEFLNTNWFEGVPARRFGLIVSNPPYLTAQEIQSAAVQVRAHEPASALLAEDNGLADLKTIISGARAFLEAGGLLALETGIDQHTALEKLASDTGFLHTQSLCDLSGRERFFLIQ